MSLVRTSTVTDARIGRWNWLQFQSLDAQNRLVNDNRVIDGTSYRYEFPNFSRPNVPYWFRVAAVGSNGLSGAWSDPVAYTPTAVNTAANNNPNTPRSFNRTGSGGALGAPTGLTIVAGNTPRTASMTWTAVAGAEGYIVELTYYNPATEHATPAYLDLSSDPTPILTGDLVILERQFLTLDDSVYASRIFGASKPLAEPPLLNNGDRVLKRDGCDWAYVPYSGDKPAIAVGDHFFRRIAPAGQTARMNYFWHSGSGQSFYPILKVGVTYRLSITMRASSTVNVVLTQSGAAATGITGTTFANVGPTFQTYTHDTVPTTIPTGTQPYDWQLAFTAGGTPINVDVAHFKIEEVGVSNNVVGATPPPANGYLRDHSFIKPGANNRLMARMITNDAYGFRKFYDTCVATGNRPWFQIEWNTPKADWLDFVAYLAAPNGSHPMADLRLASGIPEPWTTTFANMVLENGNESWNSTADFWQFPVTMTDSATAQVYNRGNVAGLFWQMISNWMKESPYWSTLAPKLTQHAGGWAVNTFGEDAYRFYPDAKEVSIAAYNGGWDNGTSLVAEKGLSFNSILADPLLVQAPRAAARVAALRTLCTSLGRNYGSDIRYTIYEAGPGYQLNGLNGVAVTAQQVIEQEVVMKSRAGAASTVDNMLTLAVQDFKGFNYFTLGRGDYWKSHASINDGDQEYMAHALVRIIHENMAPARVFGMDTTALGTKSVTLEGGGSATINQIGAYQLRNIADRSKRMIVLVNRNIDPSQLPVADPLYSATPSGSVLFNIQTIWQSATSLRAWTAGIGPFRQHNRYPVGQRRNTSGGLVSDPLCVAFDYSPTTLSVPSNLQNIAIDASVGATSGGLPAGNVLILLFEGVT